MGHDGRRDRERGVEAREAVVDPGKASPRLHEVREPGVQDRDGPGAREVADLRDRKEEIQGEGNEVVQDEGPRESKQQRRFRPPLENQDDLEEKDGVDDDVDPDKEETEGERSVHPCTTATALPSSARISKAKSCPTMVVKVPSKAVNTRSTARTARRVRR